MAILSNVNGKFAVDSTGAIKFNNLTGTNNQVLIANTGASPTWVDVSTIIGGPYLPLTGGTLAGDGNLVVGGTLTVNGATTLNAALTGTSATFVRDASGYALRLDSGDATTDNDLRFAKGGTDYAAIQVAGAVASDFQFYVNDGTNWINTLTFARADGQAVFTKLVSGITPTAAANFATKAYVDAHPGSGGTVTSVGGTGTVSGITLTGTVTSTGNLTLGGTLSASITNISNAYNWWNNFGQTHGTRTSFDASTASYGFGWRYIQGNTNGPGTGGTQFYSAYVGLGSEYPATGSGSYGAYLAFDRNVTNPYLSIRYNEANALGTWKKISAGTADILTTARTIAGVSFDGSANISLNNNAITNGAGYTTNTGNGTVTSVATGNGLSGGTITSTGTLTMSGTYSGNFNFSTNNVVVGGNFTNNPYNSTSGARLMFGSGDSNSIANYYIGTNLEDFGGNYTKLSLAWHTGIKIGAQSQYGGVRFYDDEDFSNVILNIGVSNTNVGVVNELTVGGNVGIGGSPTVSFEIAKAGARIKMIDGTNQLNMGLWDGANYRFEGDANRPMFFTSYQGNINFGISGSTTINIQSANVGIGTTSPVSKLHVQSGDIGVTTDRKIGWIYNPGSDNNMYNYIKTADNGGVPASPLEISGSRWTNGNTRGIIFTHQTGGEIMTIMTGGNVGIGTTNPSGKLEVNGNNYNTNSLTTFTLRDLGNNYSDGDNSIDIVMRSRYWSGDANTSQNSKIRHLKDNSNGSTGTMLQFGTTTEGSGDASTKMTIKANGNVGIGTTAPEHKLVAVGTIGFGLNYNGGVYVNNTITSVDENWGLEVQRTANVDDYNTRLKYYPVSGQSRAAGIYDSRNARFSLYSDTNNNPNIIIPNGNVGINNTSPGQKLSVVGDGSGTSDVVRITHGNGSHTGNGLSIRSANTGKPIYVDGSVGAGFAEITTAYNANPNIRTSGDVVAYASSDKRFKDNLEVIQNPIDKIHKLNGYTFDWNDKQDVYKGKDYGVVAQEVEKVMPELVDTRFDGYKAVKYEKLVPLLIESIKELEARVKELENK